MGTVDFPLRVVELNLLVIIFQNSWIDMMIYPNNVVPLHHPKTTDMPRQVRKRSGTAAIETDWCLFRYNTKIVAYGK